ncbi:protein translocase subunit SecF [Desulfonatronospira sp.]|uniref:protein translocase subunit SecF n=1 Tax=Desulfonatronospira sp. TaxID=1962951 RepID=UPI0025C2C432|nr:protein translocase subunit SecF [Desulfonatronospira sp.]
MGFQIIRPDTRFDFMGWRRLALIISLALILLGLTSLLIKGGPRYGIDFAGGVIIQIKFESEVDMRHLESLLQQARLQGMSLQTFGDRGDNEYLVRTSAEEMTTSDVRQRTREALNAEFQEDEYSFQRLEMVGPRVGEELRENALQALFFAVLLISIYISGRFEHKWFIAGFMAAGLGLGVYFLKILAVPLVFLILGALLISLIFFWYLRLSFALGAVLALIHDVLITVGIFSLLNKEFDLSIVAALLTIIGYSLNDTIVIYDRIRENMRKKISESLSHTINISLNQTLSRTLVTSGTTLMVILSLLILGGGIIHDFAFALLVGVVVGTYSSIFVASSILLKLRPEIPGEEEKEEIIDVKTRMAQRAQKKRA